MGSVSTICGMNTLSVQRCMGCRVRDSPKGSLARRYATAFLLESRLIDKLSIRAQLTLHEAEAEKKKKKTRMINVPSVWSVSSFSTHTHTCTHTCTHTSWASDVFVLSRKKWMDVYTLHQPQRVFAHRQQRAHGHARSPVATRLYSRGYEKKNVWAQLFSWLTSVVNGGVLT